jgi:hypothetical protein
LGHRAAENWSMALRELHSGRNGSRAAGYLVAVAGLAATALAIVLHEWTMLAVLTVLWPAAAVAVRGGFDRLLSLAPLPASSVLDDELTA